MFTAAGAAAMYQQRELTTEKVHDFVHNIVMNPSARAAMEQAMRKLSRPDAAEAIARVISNTP